MSVTVYLIRLLPFSLLASYRRNFESFGTAKDGFTSCFVFILTAYFGTISACLKNDF